MPACYLGMARHLLYKMEGEYERAFQEERIVWDRINDAFDFHYKNRRAETIGAVVNYLEALSKTEHTGLFLKHMAYIERLLADKEKDNHQLETALRINQLNHLVKSRGEALTREDIIPFEKIHASGIADQFVDFKRLFEAYLANAFFIIRDYQKAIDYIHIVQEEYKRGEVRSDNYEHSRINEIVYRGTLALSHGMNNDDIPYLHSLANSYHDIIRHKSSKDDYRFEFALTDFFRFLKQNMSSVEVLDKIDTLEKRLDQIFKEPTGYLKLIRFDFDYPIMIKRWREYAQ
jgi:tetratricopeptide (TPR) repeat protein